MIKEELIDTILKELKDYTKVELKEKLYLLQNEIPEKRAKRKIKSKRKKLIIKKKEIEIKIIKSIL